MTQAARVELLGEGLVMPTVLMIAFEMDSMSFMASYDEVRFNGNRCGGSGLDESVRDWEASPYVSFAHLALGLASPLAGAYT